MGGYGSVFHTDAHSAVEESVNPRMTRPPTQHSRAAVCVSVIATLALLTSACSGDDKESADPSDPSVSASKEAEPEVVTESAVGEIVGRLPADQQQVVQDEVSAVVDDFTNWAYLSGEYPRTEWEFPVPGFSPRASRRVERDLSFATNADIGASIDSVTPISRSVTVDVLAPRGKPAGATARYEVVFNTTGDAGESEVTVKGRLVLVPEASGWQVVGHYFAKGSS